MLLRSLAFSLAFLSLWAPLVQAQEKLQSIRFLPSAGLRYTNQSGGTVGFTSIESFFPIWQRPGHVTYIAPNFNVFDDGNLGGNFILGHRAYDLDKRRLFGGYISWDGRGLNNNFYNQIGLGFETAIDLWNVSLNGYIPVGTARNQTGEQLLGLASVPFRGNRLFLDAVNFFDAAMAGFDVELGRVILLNERGYLRPFLGGYYLTAERSENALGIRGGLQIVREIISMGLAVQYDGLFGTQALFTVGINVAELLGQKRSVPQTAMAQGMLVAQAEGDLPTPPAPSLPLESSNFIQRLGSPVSRRNSITIENQRIREDVVALAPDGHPYEVFHVLVGASGDGTAESPFGTIQPAMNAAAGAKNALVYVRPGTNTGLTPFTVPRGTQVFSSAVDYTLPVRTRFNPVRDVTIPAVPGDVRPLVQGTFGTDLTNGQGVVTLNSNTTLAGLNVQVVDPLPVGGTPGRRGIVAVGAENVRILSNTVNNALGEGIYLENVTGNAQILSNTVTGTRTNTGAFADFNGAIFVYNFQGTINATIQGNTVAVPPGATEVDGIEINLCRSGAPFTACSGSAFGNYLVTGNTVTAPGATGGADGIDFNFGTGAKAIAQIVNNSISQFPDKAISFGGVGSNNVAAVISGNTISNVVDNGIHIRPRENSNFRAPVTVNGITASGLVITNNTVTSLGQRGIDVRLDDDGGLLAPNTAQADVTISGNTVSNSGSDGLRLRTEQGGQLRAVVQGNTVTSNGGDAGIFVRSENTSQLQATLTGNTVTGSSGSEGAIFVRSQNTSQLQATLTGNTVTGTTAGAGGIVARADNTSTLCIKIQFNRSQNPALAKDFRLRRNAAGANLQLFGITAPLPVAANSTPLQTALEGQGNVANLSSNTRFQVETNTVQIPTALCTFP